MSMLTAAKWQSPPHGISCEERVDRAHDHLGVAKFNTRFLSTLPYFSSWRWQSPPHAISYGERADPAQDHLGMAKLLHDGVGLPIAACSRDTQSFTPAQRCRCAAYCLP